MAQTVTALERIRAEQIRGVYRGSVPGLIGSVFAALTLVLTLIDVGAVTPAPGIAVLVFTLTGAATRLLLVYAHRRSAPPPARWRFWANWMFASVLFSGAVWGLGAVVLMPPDRFDLQLVVLVVNLALASGAVSAFGAYLPIFLANFVPMILPPVLWMATRGDPPHYALTVLGLLWVAVIAALARQYGGNIVESLRLRFENLDLVEDLRRQKEAAEQANIAKSRFLASASHDLRQPVHALGLFVGALRLRPLDAESARLVEHVDASVSAMDGLFASLLDISRLDAGVTQPHTVAFPLRPLIERICREHTAEAAAKGLPLGIGPCSATVRSDPVLLGRILRNFIANAVRYTEQGRILVGCRRQGSRIRVEVWDTGPGIPAAEQQNIFQEFYQLGNPERDRTRGLGLGLAIVKRLAELISAEITLSSVLGRGSVFKVAVDRAEAAATPEAEPAPAVLVDQPRPGVILVVDDEIAIQEAMATLLTGWGHRVVVAGSYEEMEARIVDLPIQPDLIICDYRLRGAESGGAVIRRLQALYNIDIPALLVTGDTAPDRIKEAAASGFLLLHKPITNDALRSAIAAALSPREVAEP
jgi:signal transduction histidine kinase/ActR/RegA family two-component response regulator